MFLVVFRNRKRPDIDYAAYEADAARMLELAQAQPGYISFKSYASPDGEVIAMSEWADEAAAIGWRRQVEHLEVQGRGRTDYYESYTLFACDNPRIHEFQHKAR
ncbi:MAG: antibiotic biosynthesis monooxygenase [Porphyrobacter sp.]|nr:antibiotic biosynthesis monooxygenase [Porphyrobacter sp.]